MKQEVTIEEINLSMISQRELDEHRIKELEKEVEQLKSCLLDFATAPTLWSDPDSLRTKANKALKGGE